MCVGRTIPCSCVSLLLWKSWLLSEQSDREANESWPNRWVVTLLHWRGFTGDMILCFTEIVGRQWDHPVGCLCLKCQSVSISRSIELSLYLLSPLGLNRCLHNSSTSLARFHWQFVTNLDFFSTHSSLPLEQYFRYFQYPSEWLVLTAATFLLDHPF